ncbi:hypothetical protein GOBAR_DD02216 [Gossypium barbadense]|nr:hypothetical protein GOBAR_DD02216 [Gossypium barbadense]
MAKSLIFSASRSFALCMDETFLLSDSTFISSCDNRDKHELEVDFKRFWEEFRSSNSEKEKEAALNLTVDALCRLVKQHASVAQLVTQYEC